MNNKKYIKGILGRFGNILFTLVSGYYISQKNKYEYAIYNKFCDDKQLKYIINHMMSLSVPELASNELPLDAINLPENPDSTRYISVKCDNINEYIDDEYRQTPMYWDNDTTFIKNILHTDDICINKIKKVYNDINFDDKIAIHIRRGDYTKPQNISLIGMETIGYYLNAIEKCGKSEEYIILTDDIEYCRQYFNYSNIMFIEREVPDVEDYLRDFWIGTLCKGNIISNSTFSWWMGYLNSHIDAKIYIPQPFFREIASSNNIIPTQNTWSPIKSEFYNFMPSYKISIVMPCYNINKELFIKTMGSIDRQSIGRNNIELILIDDCSSDDTYAYIKQYAETHQDTKAFTLMENKGPGFVRSIGIQIANGKYISFLDSDDVYYSDDSIMLMYMTSLKYDTDITCGFVQIEDKLHNYYKEEKLITDCKDYANTLFTSVAGLASRLYKRDFLHKNNIGFIESYIGEDYAFVAETFTKAKRIFLSNIGAYIYTTEHSDSLVHNFTFRKLKYELMSKTAFNKILNQVGISPEGSRFNINAILGRWDIFNKLTLEEFNEIKGMLYSIFQTEHPIKIFESIYDNIINQNYEEGYKTIKALYL